MKKVIAIVGSLTLTAGMAVAGDMDEESSFSKLDVDQNGIITQSEALADETLTAHFQDADANQDGYLSATEYDAMGQQSEEVIEAE